MITDDLMEQRFEFLNSDGKIVVSDNVHDLLQQSRLQQIVLTVLHPNIVVVMLD